MIENLVTSSINTAGQDFHWHEEVEIDFMLKGNMTVVINNRRIELSVGDIVVTNREDIHCIESPDTDVIYMQTLFNLKSFDQYIPDLSTTMFKCDPTDNDVISENLKTEIKQHLSIIAESTYFDFDENNREKKIIYSCIEILSSLKLGFKYVRTENGRKKNEYQFDRMWKIVDYVYDNCTRKLTLKELADHVHISEVYLSKIMKKFTHWNFSDFLAFVRAETSIKYLLSSDMSITNIAYECGFSAPRYYIVAFEKNYGCSPSEWRQKNQRHSPKSNVKKLKTLNPEEKEMVKRLLQSYYVNEENQEESVADYFIDIDQEINQYEATEHKATAVKCTELHLISLDFQQLILLCKDSLGIKKILIKESNSKHREIAQRNINLMGFDTISDTEQGNVIEIEKLFINKNIKSEYFYIQQQLSYIPKRCNIISNELVVYRENGLLNLTLMNLDSVSQRKFMINFSGIEKEVVYWLRKVMTKKMPSIEIEELNDEAKLHLGEYMKPQEEIEIISGKYLAIWEVLLEPNQICTMSIDKMQ